MAARMPSGGGGSARDTLKRFFLGLRCMVSSALFSGFSFVLFYFPAASQHKMRGEEMGVKLAHASCCRRFSFHYTMLFTPPPAMFLLSSNFCDGQGLPSGSIIYMGFCFQDGGMDGGTDWGQAENTLGAKRT